jgi:NADPH-dependent curcumin reductase CurA
MTERPNRQIVLRRRPVGEPREDDFELVTRAIADPGEGEMLLRTSGSRSTPTCAAA